MSLIELRWIVLSGAGAVAVGAPAVLLSGDASPVPVSPAAGVTEIAPGPPGMLSFALAAPPFAPGRIPPGGAAPEAMPDEPAAPPPVPPRLVGIVTGGAKAIALVRGSDGETRTLARGESVDGWRLVGVARDSATFDLGGERHTAVLDFANREPRQAPPPAPPPSFTPPQAPPEPHS